MRPRVFIARHVNSAERVSDELASMLARCAVHRRWAEQDQGPYYRDAQPQRRDVVEDREGMALRLGVRLVGGLDSPVRAAPVDIWQCDALGRYSGFPPSDSSVVVTADTDDTDEVFPTGGDPAVLGVSPVGDGSRAAICLVLPTAANELNSGPAVQTRRRSGTRLAGRPLDHRTSAAWAPAG